MRAKLRKATKRAAGRLEIQKENEEVPGRADTTRTEHGGVEAAAATAKPQRGSNQPTVAIPQLTVARYRTPPARLGNPFTLRGWHDAPGHHRVSFDLGHGRKQDALSS